MVKSILYTSNPNFVPNNLEQVENFAEESGKYYTCMAREDSELGSVSKGAHIKTAKGNNVYILEVGDGNYDYAKKCNITGILSVDYPFSNNKQSVNKMTNNSIKGISARIKEMFMPTEAKDVRIATDGNICVATTQGYVAIDKNNCLTSYPEELTLNLPVFIISKPKDQLQVGDVIALERSYAKVTKIEGDKITAIGYTGAGKTVHTIKDFLFNQTMVRVVTSLAGNIGGQMNPMLLFALSNKEDKNSILPFLMMNQNGGTLGMNPMMLMLLSGKGDDFDVKDMLMMSALSGNTFGGMFGQVSQQPAVQQVVDNEQPEPAEVQD